LSPQDFFDPIRRNLFFACRSSSAVSIANNRIMNTISVAQVLEQRCKDERSFGPVSPDDQLACRRINVDGHGFSLS
jgi:hypothetical protein